MLDVITIFMDIIIILLMMFIFRVIRMAYMNKKTLLSIVLLVMNMVLFGYFMIYNLFHSIIIFIFFTGYFIIIYFLGKKGYYNIQHKVIELATEKIENDFQFLFLADFQYDKTKSDRNDKAFDNLIKEVEVVLQSRQIDTILLGGDYVNYQENIDWFFERLKSITVGKQVYAILGNHDFIDREKIEKKLQELNVVLLNNNYVLSKINNQEVIISGVDDLRMGKPDYFKYSDEIDNSKYHVMLSHNPDYVDRIRKEQIDLILAGHYHNGQINMIPNVSAAKVITRYAYGLYRLTNSILYVTSGLGGSMMRGKFATYVRWNADAEIVIVDVKRNEL